MIPISAYWYLPVRANIYIEALLNWYNNIDFYLLFYLMIWSDTSQCTAQYTDIT